MQERNFTEYLPTSALKGDGCPELKQAIIEQIDWKSIPYTASPRIFKLLKDEILKLRDQGIVLLHISELKQQLDLRLPQEHYTLPDLRAVVRLLAGPGIIWQLEFGDFVLLQPEWINKYAAAVIRSVRAHMGEIGIISETQVLNGDLNYTIDHRPTAPDSTLSSSAPNPYPMQRLDHTEEEIVLRAMHQTLVDRGICTRTPTAKGIELIFPSYFKRELPEDPGHPPILITYCFNGSTSNSNPATLTCTSAKTTKKSSPLKAIASESIGNNTLTQSCSLSAPPTVKSGGWILAPTSKHPINHCGENAVPPTKLSSRANPSPPPTCNECAITLFRTQVNETIEIAP